jgi:CheY-like chemotaxis protein
LDSSAPTPVVLIINSSEDTIEMLRLVFEQRGWNSASAHVADLKRGRADLLELVRQHQPAVIVYDLAPPYEENLVFLRALRTSSALEDVPFVLTTTNEAAVRKAGGPDDTLEIFGKPFDLGAVCEAADRVSRLQPRSR